MQGRDFLTQGFDTNRTHLHSVAYRMLGSRSEAEDAVQEAWIRLARADTSAVENLRSWLTTVVARVCLDMLRTRRARGEEPMAIHDLDTAVDDDAERETMTADSVGVAMLVVLERLTPAERVAFVLHDMFDLPFDDIAHLIGRSPAATRQLASRARRRVQGSREPSDADGARQREIIAAFLDAARRGDFTALLSVLDPNVVLRADAVAVQESLARQRQGAPTLAPELIGAAAVAETFKGRARAAQPALVDGGPGLVFAPSGQPKALLEFVVEGGRITEIAVIANPESIRERDLEIIGE